MQTARYSASEIEPLNLAAHLQSLWRGIACDARDLVSRLEASSQWKAEQFEIPDPNSPAT